MTIEEWMAKVVSGAMNKQRGGESSLVRANPQISSLSKVSFEWEAEGRPLEEDVAYFFKLRGEAFQAVLRTLKGDPQVASHEAVLDHVVASMRLIEKDR
jgi:hypothetical protein